MENCIICHLLQKRILGFFSIKDYYSAIISSSLGTRNEKDKIAKSNNFVDIQIVNWQEVFSGGSKLCHRPLIVHAWCTLSTVEPV